MPDQGAYPAHSANNDPLRAELESLKKIIEYSTGAKDRLQSAYNLRHGGKTQQQAPQAPVQTGGAYDDPAKEQRYQQWLRSQGR